MSTEARRNIMNKIRKIPAIFMRGGTSKGLFINEALLPPAGKVRDEMLLAMMGSPDPSGMQLNGMGCGISSTSKIALISKAKDPNFDVNYLFGQVNLSKPLIDWEGSCGNLASAVGLLAVQENYVKPEKDGSAKVRVWQSNLKHGMCIHVSADTANNLISIPGVPGKSSSIYVEFIDPGHGKSLIPHNKPIHVITLPDGKKIEATLMRSANPTIFVNAKDLGLENKETPIQINFANYEHTFQVICEQGAAIMEVPYTPAVRVAWLSPAKAYQTAEGEMIDQAEIDLISLIATEGRVHHAHTGTGAINLACAAKIPGTVPEQIIQLKDKALPIRIGHPKGIMAVNANVVFDPTTEQWQALSSGFLRTAKILMKGDVYL